MHLRYSSSTSACFLTIIRRYHNTIKIKYKLVKIKAYTTHNIITKSQNNNFHKESIFIMHTNFEFNPHDVLIHKVDI